MTQEEHIKIFASNLNRIMAERGITQAEAHKALNIAPQSLNNWVKGKSIPRMKMLQALADYLECENADLIEPYNPKANGNTLDLSELIKFINNDSNSLVYNGQELTSEQRAAAKAALSVFKNIIDAK